MALRLSFAARTRKPEYPHPPLHFPTEIIVLILNHVECRSSLLASSLVDRTWSTVAQALLFETLRLTIHIHTLDDLAKLSSLEGALMGRTATITPDIKCLNRLPILASSVRRLQIRTSEGVTSSPSTLNPRKMSRLFQFHFPTLLNSFQNVQEVVLDIGRMFYRHSMCTRFPSETWVAITSLIGSPNLLTLTSLQYLNFQDFSSLFNAVGPNIRSLTLTPISCGDDDQLPYLPSNIRIQSFFRTSLNTPLTSNDVYETFISSDVFSELEHLELTLRAPYYRERHTVNMIKNTRNMIRRARSTLKVLRIDISLEEPLFELVDPNTIRAIRFDLCGRVALTNRIRLNTILEWVISSLDTQLYHLPHLIVTFGFFQVSSGDVDAFKDIWKALDEALANADVGLVEVIILGNASCRDYLKQQDVLALFGTVKKVVVLQHPVPVRLREYDVIGVSSATRYTEVLTKTTSLHAGSELEGATKSLAREDGIKE